MNQHEVSHEDQLIEDYLHYLRGEGPAPQQASDLFVLLDAITDMGPELPPIEHDPVAQALDLVPPVMATSAGAATADAGPLAATLSSPGHQTTSERRRGRHRLRRNRVVSGMVAIAVVLVAASTFVLRGSSPALAVEIGTLTSQCASTFRGTEEARASGVPHVVVAAVWAGEERDRFIAVLDSFARRTGIKVSLATDPPEADRNIGATLDSLARQGCPPDVALLPQPGLLTSLARGGRLTPLDDATAALVEQNYSPAWQELGKVDGTPYGVWFKAANKSIIWYNANVFARAGVEPPTDWEGLKDVAARLRAAGIAPFALAGAAKDAWVLSDWFENVYLRTAGSANYEALATGQLAWTDQSVKAALARLAEIFGRDEWLAGGRRAALETTYEGSVKEVFGDRMRPSAAMVFEGDFVANVVAETPSKVGVDARFFPFPSMGAFDPTLVGVGGPAAAGEAGGDVAVMMTPTGEGKSLVAYLASAEAAQPWVDSGGFISPNRTVVHYPDVTSKLAAEQLLSAESLHFDLSDRLTPAFGSDSERGMWVILRDFLADPRNIDGTAQRLEREFRATMPRA